MRKIVLALLILLIVATVAAADTVYLRDGRSIRGTVLGYIGGRFAVRVDQQTQITTGNNNATQTVQAGEIAYLRPRDIERVEIEGRNLDEARYLTRNVEVTLGPNWIDSGIDVRRGQRIQITSTGTIYAGRSRLSPGGLRSTDPNAPLPNAAEGVLIGAIGTDSNAPIIEIGTSREFQAASDGRLYLTVNRADYTDARGSFNAQVRREVEFGRRAGSTGRSNNADDDNDFDPYGAGAGSPGAVRRRRRGDGPGTAPTTNVPMAPVTQEKTVIVPGNSRGTDTGVDLRTGDSVTISASGNITAGRRAGVVSADGGRVGVISAYPVPQAGVGALIGYIRTPNGQTTQPFLVGSQQTFNAATDGRLFLLINDDNYGDNSGQFDVRITYTTQISGGAGAAAGGGTGERSVNVEGRSESYSFRRNYIASQNTFTAPSDGRLLLFVNDYNYGDNSGSFSVRLAVQ